MLKAQKQSTTSLFRNMPALRTASVALADNPRPKILSFGCSVGDEIATLKFVFPEAEIFGCDIKRSVLKTARHSVGHLATVFMSDEHNLKKHGPYDLIVASAVLCLNPPKDIANKFPFDRFHEMIRMLDGVVADRGILMITNASYRFQDTETSREYTVIRSDINTFPSFVDVFAPDGRPFLVQKRIEGAPGYFRGEALKLENDRELFDCLFRKTGRESGGPEFHTLAPVPPGFKEDYRVDRTLIDKAPHLDTPGLLRFSICHRFGRDLVSGTRGIARQIRWPSLVGEGEEFYWPETWELAKGVHNWLG